MTYRAAPLDQRRIWIRPRYDSFNGIRGLAVAMVFVCHYGGPIEFYTAQTLWVGVDLFFVLSGFLITGILYDSLQNDHFFSHFYVRRALRIFPVTYGFFLLVFALAPLLHLHYARGLFAFVFYVGNLTVNLSKSNPTIIWTFHHGQQLQVANVGALWSLCVEEQFYLIWPAVVWFVRDRVRLMWISGAVSAMTLLLRISLIMWTHPLAVGTSFMYWNTLTRCDTLLIGAWLALFLRGNALSLRQLRRASSLLFWPAAIAFAIGRTLSHGDQGSNPFIESVGFTLIALAAAGVLMRSLDDGSRLSYFFRLRWLSGLGVISYGIYVYHAMPYPLWMHVAEAHPSLKNFIPFFAFTTTVLIAWASFRFYETPFLRLKSKLAPRVEGKPIQAQRLPVSR